MRYQNGNRTSASFANLTSRQKKPKQIECARCGTFVPVSGGARKYCGPCSDVVLTERAASYYRRKTIARGTQT